MLKRFENLGTALSRNESKKVMGGDGAYYLTDAGDGDGACDDNCTTLFAACTTTSGGTGTCNSVNCTGSTLYFKTCS